MSIPVCDSITPIAGGLDLTARRGSHLLAAFVAFLFALLGLSGTQQLRAQCGQPGHNRCEEADCRTDQLLLNTGYDHNAGGVYPVGVQDGFWTIVQDANPARPVPRPANVIAPAPGWGGPIGNSQWIGANRRADDDFLGDVTYEKCFCVCERTDLQFDMDILADDEASVLFDGIPVGGTPNPGYPGATHLNFNQTVDPGRHCLQVVVKNTRPKYAGVDIEGTVTGQGLLRYNCCPLPVTEQLSDCQTTKLTLVTDDTWTMVSGPPADPLNYPRCATIITNPHPAWAPAIPGTNWIGRDIWGSSEPGCVPFSGVENYLYRKSFCVDKEGTFVITITSRADDAGNISLNGVPLGTTDGFNGPLTPQTFIVYLFPGCNCFEFNVSDLGCAVTGLDALIDIQGGIMLKPECCDCGRCNPNPVARRQEGNDALSAVPNADMLAPRPTLVSIPNPSTGEAVVHYVMDKDASAQLDLYNIAGERVMVVDKGMRKSGQHAVPVVTKGLPAGAYRLQLKYGEKTLSIPLNVQ